MNAHPNQYYALQDACKQFLKRGDWRNSYAVTTHLKERFRFPQDHEVEKLRLDASLNNKYFLKRLDYCIYGNSSKPTRGNKRTTRIVAIEEGKDRIHCHFLIACPPKIDLKLMQDYCRISWLKTPFAISDIDVKKHTSYSPASSFGTYIMKQIRGDNSDALDYENIHLPPFRK